MPSPRLLPVGAQTSVVLLQQIQEDLAPGGGILAKGIETEAELAAALEGQRPETADAWDAAVARRDRTSYVENAFNDRRQGGNVLKTDVDPRYRFGQRFDVPMLPLAADVATFVETKRPFPGSAAARALLLRDGVKLPVHPQMADLRRAQQNAQQSAADQASTIAARTSSSERTVRIIADGHELLLKLDLAEVENTYFIRPVSVADGERVVAKSDLLAAWFDAHPSAGARVAFEPEIAVVGRATGDSGTDCAAIVRDAVPYPPPAAGKSTWALKMYSLLARDPAGVAALPRLSRPAPPLIAQLIEQRPDPTIDRVAYAKEKILGPLVEAALTVHVDWGAACNLHMQNSALEIGEDGHPTGRVIISDLEDIHLRPHDPALRRAAAASGVLEDVPDGGAFKSFDHWAVAYNLNELRRCLAEAFPSDGPRFRAAINELIRDGLEQRRAMVQAGAGAEPDFARLLDKGPSY